jgi:hypothetical protein
MRNLRRGRPVNCYSNSEISEGKHSHHATDDRGPVNPTPDPIFADHSHVTQASDTCDRVFADHTPDHGIRPNYEQRISPFEESCQDGQADPSRRIYTPRLDSALFEQCQLAAKKQILGLDQPRWPE